MLSTLVPVLLLYLATQLIEQLLVLLNHRHLARHGDEVPMGFESRLDAATLGRMRDYTLARGRVGLVAAAFDILVTLVFFFGPGLNWYNRLIAGWGMPELASGLAFFLILLVAASILHIPFDLYATFRVEQRFGFNRKTLGLWLADFVKGQLVGLVLGGLLLAGVLYLIGTLPQWWWLAAWLFILVFNLFIVYLSPLVIEPLFNRFTPITDEALEAGIREIMERAGLAISKVLVMDASKRSGHSNAYFTGIGPVKRIVLFDTLLAESPTAEVLAILAHEAGHWRKKHILKRLLATQAVVLLCCWLAWQLVQGETLSVLFGLDPATLPAKLLLVGFLLSLLFFWLRPLSAWWSRRHEKEADRFAVGLVGDGRPLAEALVRLGCDNLANLHPHPLYATFHYSHPPMAQRVQGLLGEGG